MASALHSATVQCSAGRRAKLRSRSALSLAQIRAANVFFILTNRAELRVAKEQAQPNTAENSRRSLTIYFAAHKDKKLLRFDHVIISRSRTDLSAQLG